jgi:hypothetical protein
MMVVNGYTVYATYDMVAYKFLDLNSKFSDLWFETLILTSLAKFFWYIDAAVNIAEITSPNYE